jgi:type II secretory pathway pseudopilin PulG
MVNEMLMNKPVVNKMTGLTMLETMFALALGTLVLASAILFYQSTQRSAAVSKTMTDMNAIRTGYKSYLTSGYQFNASTDALQLQAVQDVGFLPNPLNNAWGQAYIVSLTDYPGYITIAIPGLGTTKYGSGPDSRCDAIWAIVQTTGGYSTNLPGTDYNCAFRYRFP